MRNFFGMIMILAGVALGLYMGLWICMIGGIVDMVNNFPHDVVGVLWGAVKFFFSGLAGYASAFLLIAPGAVMLED